MGVGAGDVGFLCMQFAEYISRSPETEYHSAMNDREPENREPEEADEPVEEYENDDDELRASLEREAGLTSFGGPAFGPLFGRPDGDDGEIFDAQHNP